MKKISFKNIPWWIYGAIIHFLLGFIWSPIIFTDKALDMGIVPMNQIVSGQMEHILHIIYAKGISFLLLLLIWSTLYKVVHHQITKNVFRLFGIIFFILLIIELIYFPGNFAEFEMDNSIVYSYAIRNIPYYWHGALTSVYYSACLYILPHPIVIQLFSIGFFSALIPFAWFRLRNMKAFCLVVAWLTETWIIIFNPYRGNLYLLLLLWTLFLLIEKIQNEEKTDNSWLTDALILFLLAVIAVWRSEGILFAGGFFLIYLFGVQKCKISKEYFKKIFVYVFCLGLFWIILSAPQKIGNKKYFNKDYLIQTTTDWLCCIFNDESSNLSYAGIEKDLQTIEKIVPPDLIRDAGWDSFRVYNARNNRYITQSLASAQDSSAYMKAAANIVLHNPVPFIKSRISLAVNSNGGEYFTPFAAELLDCSAEYAKINEAWQLGNEEILNAPFVRSWENNGIRHILFFTMNTLRNMWGDGVHLQFTAYLMAALIFLKHLVDLIRKRKPCIWLPFLLLIGLGEIGLITIGAPEPRAAYYYPVYYFLLALDCVYIEDCIKKTIRKQN